MNNNPQTERETVDHELGMFTPESYKQSLWGLSVDELREECFRQYQLSGEMLNKYRVQADKADGYRRQRDSEKIEARRWARIAQYLAGGAQFAIEHLTAIQVNTRESVGYTHNAMEVVRRLVNNGAQRAIDRLNEELDKHHEAKHTAPEEMFDIPF